MGGGSGAVRSVVDHAVHTPYSDPVRFVDLLADVPTDLPSLAAVARNVIVHYRASGHELPGERATRSTPAGSRTSSPLTRTGTRGRYRTTGGDGPRPGLLSRPHPVCVGALRSHGIAARSRVGFAGYFVDGWHHDHVIVEAWLDDRWVRFDSEIDAPRPSLPTPMDIGPCRPDGTGFVTAAEAWAGFAGRDRRRRRTASVRRCPASGEPFFIFDEVIYEVAHRFGDELLLWDGWGRIGEPDRPVAEADAAWLDPIAELLIAADQGDDDAERSLLEQYRSDEGLHPGPVIEQASPYGEPPIEVLLRQR